MSVRRLAEEAVQPATFAFSAENDNWATRLIGRYPAGRQQSAVIPLLMRAQEQEGWVTKAAIEHVADRLAMPLIRVLEVATFYTQFQLKPVGTKAHVQVCGTTPCMLRGSDGLKEVCRRRIHEEQFFTNAAGTLSWEEVECLGACVNAPMVMVFKDTYEDLTPERLEEIVDALERGEPVQPGPQIDRHLSVPVGGLTTLTSFKDDEEIGEREEGVETAGAPPQGAGAGEAAHIAPSQAGRPDTHAAETDPSIKSPGASVGAAPASVAESAESADPDAGLETDPGQTGGTRQGPTGAERKENEAEEVSASLTLGADAPGEGKLQQQEGAAQDRVVPQRARPTEAEGPEETKPPRPADLSGREELEGRRRVSSDTGAAMPPAVPDVPQGRGLPAGGTAERPSGLLSEAPADRDDLKRLNGVGPIIETKLNELGIYRFDQIAALSEAELLWVDNQLNFRGRALRDRWVEQARALASERSGKAE